MTNNCSENNDVIRHPAYDKSHPFLWSGTQPAAALRHQLNAALHHSRSADHEPALLVLKIDEFLEMSERFGESFATKLSAGVERRLNDCLRDTDLVRKLGADEFAIVLGSLKNVEDICNIAQHLIDTCSGHYELGVLAPSINTSLGIALFHTDGDQSEELLRCARIALHQSSGTQQAYQFFSGDLRGREKNNYWMDAKMELYA